MANMTHTINMEIKTIVFLQTNTVIRIFSNCLVNYFFRYNLNTKQLSFHVKIFVKSTSSVGNIKADPDPHPDPDLQKKHNQDLYKKRILYQNSQYQLQSHFLTIFRVLISNMTIFSFWIKLVY